MEATASASGWEEIWATMTFRKLREVRIEEDVLNQFPKDWGTLNTGLDLIPAMPDPGTDALEGLHLGVGVIHGATRSGPSMGFSLTGRTMDFPGNTTNARSSTDFGPRRIDGGTNVIQENVSCKDALELSESLNGSSADLWGKQKEGNR